MLRRAGYWKCLGSRQLVFVGAIFGALGFGGVHDCSADGVMGDLTFGFGPSPAVGPLEELPLDFVSDEESEGECSVEFDILGEASADFEPFAGFDDIRLRDAGTVAFMSDSVHADPSPSTDSAPETRASTYPACNDDSCFATSSDEPTAGEESELLTALRQQRSDLTARISRIERQKPILDFCSGAFDTLTIGAFRCWKECRIRDALLRDLKKRLAALELRIGQLEAESGE